MKVRKLFSYILTTFLITSVILYLNKMDEAFGIYPYEVKSNISITPDNPKFIYLGGSSFKTVGSKPVYADDCIGCGEIGDISVYRNTEINPELTRYTVEAQCGKGNQDLVERSEQLNELGEKIGVRCLVSYSYGKAHIFWTEGEEFWFITTSSLELAKEFESSAVYRSWKSKIK